MGCNVASSSLSSHSDCTPHALDHLEGAGTEAAEQGVVFGIEKRVLEVISEFFDKALKKYFQAKVPLVWRGE